MSLIELKGMTWDHPRGLECLQKSNDLLIEKCGISITWDARSLLAFGDQHISEFYSDYDLMVIDHIIRVEGQDQNGRTYLHASIHTYMHTFDSFEL